MNVDFLPVKLIFFALLLWPISRVWLRFKEGTVRMGTFLFWTGLWIAGVFAIFFPGFLTFTAQKIGVGRGSDLVIYLALVLIFYLIFRMSVTIENIRNDISSIIREMALRDKNQKKKK